MKRIAMLTVAALAACGNAVLQSPEPEPACEPEVSMHVVVISNAPVPTDPQEFHFLGQCLERTPAIESTGIPACVIAEARHTGGTCACDPAAARLPITPEHEVAVARMRASKQAATLGVDCFCEIPLLQGPERDACANDVADAPAVDGQPVDGVCYVDATVTPPIGDPELTQNCPSTEPRILRFVGKGAPSASPGDSAVFVLCEQDACASP